MNGKNPLRMCVFVFLMLTSAQSQASVHYRSLPQLVHDAPTIVRGSITIQDEKIILNVEKTLKGQEHLRLRVLYLHWFDVPDPRFKNGEDVLLFLHIPDLKSDFARMAFPDAPEPKKGEMYLLGLGDQAKWPRSYPEKPKKHEYYHHFPRLQDNASLDAIQNVVEKLLEIENEPNLDEKVKLCTKYIRSPNRLLQFTAMQYAVWDYLWAPPPGKPGGSVPTEVARERFNILRNLSDEVLSLSLVDSNEPSLRAESIRLLRYALPKKAMPHLISRITDEDKLVRSATRTTLNTMAYELKITGPFVKYKHDDHADRLKSVQQQWSDWWRENRDRVKE